MKTQLEEKGYELCIMRHGIAVDRASGTSSSDSRRALTPEGRERMTKIALGLLKTGFRPQGVVSSPYLRAAETAKIVADSIEPQPTFELCDALKPGGAPANVLAFLSSRPQFTRVLMVGHEPDLSELAALLLGASRQTDLAFKKGGCCLISFERFPPQAPGRLIWWLTPRVLRGLV